MYPIKDLNKNLNLSLYIVHVRQYESIVSVFETANGIRGHQNALQRLWIDSSSVELVHLHIHHKYIMISDENRYE